MGVQALFGSQGPRRRQQVITRTVGQPRPRACARHGHRAARVSPRLRRHGSGLQDQRQARPARRLFGLRTTIRSRQGRLRGQVAPEPFRGPEVGAPEFMHKLHLVNCMDSPVAVPHRLEVIRVCDAHTAPVHSTRDRASAPTFCNARMRWKYSQRSNSPTSCCYIRSRQSASSPLSSTRSSMTRTTVRAVALISGLACRASS